MLVKTFRRVLLLLGLILIGGLAVSAQGRVPRPSKPATSMQRGKTNSKPTGHVAHKTKKMYSYSEFVNSDFGRWVENYGILPFVITPMDSDGFAERNHFNSYNLRCIMINNPDRLMTLVGVNVSKELMEEVINGFGDDLDRNRFIIASDRNEYSNFIPGTTDSMILFTLGSTDKNGYLLFDEDSSVLSDVDKLQLYIMAQSFNSDDSQRRISGCTDRRIGTADYHNRLSWKRAESVYNFLVNECQVRSDKLIRNISDDTWFIPVWSNCVSIWRDSATDE